VGRGIKERYIAAVSSDLHSSAFIGVSRPTYCEVTSISKHRPLLWTKWHFDHPASDGVRWLMHCCHGIL